MTLVPSNTRFIGFSELANLEERKSEFLNSISQPFSMQDIADSAGNFEVKDPYYNNPAIKAKIETYSAAWAGRFVDGSTNTFLTIDLSKSSAFSLEYSIYSFNGVVTTGIYFFTSTPSSQDGAIYSSKIGFSDFYFNYNRNSNIVNFSLGTGNPDGDVEIVYTIKKFTTPMFND